MFVFTAFRHLRNRGPTLDADYHFRFSATFPAISVRLSDTPTRLGGPLHRLGSDAEAILRDLGIEDALPALTQAWVLQTSDLLSAW